MPLLPLVISLLLWGSAFPAIRAALEGYPPVTMAVVRFVIASMSLVPFAIFKGFQLPRKKDLPLIVLSAFFSIPGYHVCLNIGEKYVTASAASLIISTLPIWTICWSRLFLKETFHPLAWAGVLMSFAGAAIIAFGEGGGFHLNPHVLFILASALCGSVYTVFQKKLIDQYDVVSFNCYVIWFGTLFLLPFSDGSWAALQSAPVRATISVVYLGVFPGALTFILWASVVKRMPASRAVTFLYLIPVVATVVGWLWLGELPSTLSMIGGVVILAGVLLTKLLMKRVRSEGANQGL